MRAPIGPEPRRSGSRSRVGQPWVRQWGGSGSRVGDAGMAPEGEETPGAGGCSWTHLSASNECPAEAPSLARPPRPWQGPTAPTGRGAFCGGLGKRYLPRPFSGERLPKSKPAGPSLGSVTPQTCPGRPRGWSPSSASSAVPALGQRWEVWAALGGSPAGGARGSRMCR